MLTLKKFLKMLLPIPLLNKGRFLYAKLRMLWVGIKIKLSLPLKKKHTKIRFRVHLVEHCNLNCAGCDNFSPLADPEFLGIEEFSRDINQLGRLFRHECEEIGLLGGEPLLHPEILTFMKLTRDNFATGKITIVTNGILLAQKEETFWRACHDNDIEIEITHYPIRLDIQKINAMASKFDVRVRWYGSVREDMGEKQFFYSKAIDISGGGNFKKNFGACLYANSCVMLSHGRLFACTFPPNVRHFNKKFGVNIPVTKFDYIDIYGDVNADSILQKLSEPTPICRYCHLEGEHFFRWHQSNGDINEWL